VWNYRKIIAKTVGIGNMPSELIQMGSKDYCLIFVKKKKILVIGNSHAKGLAYNLLSHLGNDFEIMGTVIIIIIIIIIMYSHSIKSLQGCKTTKIIQKTSSNINIIMLIVRSSCQKKHKNDL
jgi:hypothetical protein